MQGTIGGHSPPKTGEGDERAEHPKHNFSFIQLFLFMIKRLLMINDCNEVHDSPSLPALLAGLLPPAATAAGPGVPTWRANTSGCLPWQCLFYGYKDGEILYWEIFERSQAETKAQTCVCSLPKSKSYGKYIGTVLWERHADLPFVEKCPNWVFGLERTAICF